MLVHKTIAIFIIIVKFQKDLFFLLFCEPTLPAVTSDENHLLRSPINLLTHRSLVPRTFPFTLGWNEKSEGKGPGNEVVTLNCY